MTLGKKTRFQAKQRRREAKKEQHKNEMIKVLGLVFAVGMVASLLIVKVITIIYPILANFVKEKIQAYRSGSVNPFLKSNLVYEDFKLNYLQKEPVLLLSTNRKAHMDAVAEHFRIVCTESPHSIQSCNESAEEICTGYNEESGSDVFFDLFGASRRTFNYSPQLHTPTLRFSQDEVKPLSNFRGGDIQIDVVFSNRNMATNNDNYSVPPFRRGGHGWHELILGKKKWFLFRPGSFPSVGFDGGKSLMHWLEAVYPYLSTAERPIEISQDEGQILYIPEGWYYASLTNEAQNNSEDASLFHSILSTCSQFRPLHGDSNSSSSAIERKEGSKHLLSAVSVYQEAKSPELIQTEFYHLHRGLRLMNMSKYDEAVDSFLQAIAYGSEVEEVDMTSANPFSPKNDYFAIYSLGLAYASLGDISKAEKCLKYSSSHNRLHSPSRIALAELYLKQHMLSMARSVLTSMDTEDLFHPDLFTLKYLSNFDRICKSL